MLIERRRRQKEIDDESEGPIGNREKMERLDEWSHKRRRNQLGPVPSFFFNRVISVEAKTKTDRAAISHFVTKTKNKNESRKRNAQAATEASGRGGRGSGSGGGGGGGDDGGGGGGGGRGLRRAGDVVGVSQRGLGPGTRPPGGRHAHTAALAPQVAAPARPQVAHPPPQHRRRVSCLFFF